MFKDLLIAAVVTLICGTLCFDAFFVGLPGGLTVAGMVLSIGAGPLILWRRGTQPLIPISAVYAIVMFIALSLVYFQLAWGRGLVDL